MVQPTNDAFYVPQGSSTNIINSFLRFVVGIVTTNVTGKEIDEFIWSFFSVFRENR